MMDSAPSSPPASRPVSPAAPGVDDGQQDGKSTLADLLPWAATVLLHAAAVIIAILLVWVTMDKTDEVEPIIPAIGVPSDRPAALNFKRETSRDASEKWERPSPSADPRETSKTDAKQLADIRLIGNIGHAGEPTGAFRGAQTGVGDGTIFRDPPTGGTNAKSFAFVIDASGSMIDTLPFVMAELKRTIRSLSEKHHSFTVLFYQDEKVFEALGPGLKPATEEMKTRAFDWLDNDAMAPAGLSNPILAIEQGLKYKPEVMFLLSDNITGAGRYELNQHILLARIKRANAGGTKINTIQFLYPDPLSRIPGMKPTMQLISEQSGGLYRFVTGKELGL